MPAWSHLDREASVIHYAKELEQKASNLIWRAKRIQKRAKDSKGEMPGNLESEIQGLEYVQEEMAKTFNTLSHELIALADERVSA